MRKKKIAVIGGGLGAMTTVCQLMKLPGAADMFDITVYQLGWRLGGKGASGVNRSKGHRVEEHGIHFWFGFYENAFAQMRQVYDELGRPPGSPLATFDDAFKAQPYMVFAENVNGNWVDWRVDFPDMPGTAGDGHFINPIQEIFTATFNYLALEFRRYFEAHPHGCLGWLAGRLTGKTKRPKMSGPIEAIVQDLEKKIGADAKSDVERHLRVMGQVFANQQYHGPDYVPHHLINLARLRKWIWDLLGYLVHTDNTLRRLWTSLDFAIAFVHGMLADGVLRVENGRFVLDFSVINDHDYKDWLVMHGMDAAYAFDFPPVKSMYDGPFAFFRGNAKAPNVEAGTALNIFLRLALSCKEHVMWRMQAGMGDTVFAPMYLWLKKYFPENVHFRFFHKARHLHLSKDKSTVDVLELEQQVRLKKGLEEYSPLFPVNDLLCWPSEPLYDQLDPEQAKALQTGGISLDDNWSGWSEGTPVLLKRGVDFDAIVIGASLASLPDFCSELINQNPAWARMLSKVGTVVTQAFQLWLTKDPAQLGVDPQKILSCYVEPLDTYAEMNQILLREQWNNVPVKPKYLFYVCGAQEDAGDIPPYSVTVYPPTQREEVFHHMKAYIRHELRHVLPGAFDAAGNFDWSILVDAENRSGEERLLYQYWRSNVDPSERYVFALAGSSKYRLRTDESGFAGVFLTGDWIQNGLNIGFVEGAVISGILTARAVSGDPNIPIFLPW